MPPVAATSTLAGAVIGGVAPISGSIVALYRAGATLGGSAQSLGTSTSDPQGRFSIPFTNPGTSAILYLVASGGDAGHGPNPAIQLALMLGRADTLPSAPVTVNEVTSVVFGYAMNFFIQASSDHSISGASPALDHAAATPALLVDPVNGAVKASLDANAQSMINGLADILASCVGGTPSSCNSLFSAAAPSGGITPENTLSVLLDLVENPTGNVSTLWGLIGSSPPYPTTSTIPSMVALALNFAGGALFNGPSGIAVDGSGNVWVANINGDSVTEIPKGVTSCASSSCPIFSGAFDVPRGIAVDGSGNVWVANINGDSVTEIPKGVTSCASSSCRSSAGPLAGLRGSRWTVPGTSGSPTTSVTA